MKIAIYGQYYQNSTEPIINDIFKFFYKNNVDMVIEQAFLKILYEKKLVTKEYKTFIYNGSCSVGVRLADQAPRIVPVEVCQQLADVPALGALVALPDEVPQARAPLRVVHRGDDADRLQVRGRPHARARRAGGAVRRDRGADGVAAVLPDHHRRRHPHPAAAAHHPRSALASGHVHPLPPRRHRRC